MTDAPDLTPREAVERFLTRRATDSADSTVRSYRNRLEHFVEWCDAQDIETVGDLRPFDVDEFQLNRKHQGYQPSTVRGQLSALQVCLKYLADIGVVDDAIPEAVDVPTLSVEEKADDTRLDPDDATELLRFFRDSAAYYGRPTHAVLELTRHVGCRVGGLRALDRGDFDADEQTLAFRHRPSTGTPLKNQSQGERVVGLSHPVVAVLEVYIERERQDTRDEHGRAPLFGTRQGRASLATLRAWAYQATQPCLYTSCPHGRRRSTCEFTERTHASKCPSSRSPHPIRTGSITWQLNRGRDIEHVAARVNASPATIRRFYDKQTEREEFEERRRETAHTLDIDIDEEANS